MGNIRLNNLIGLAKGVSRFILLLGAVSFFFLLGIWSQNPTYIDRVEDKLTAAHKTPYRNILIEARTLGKAGNTNEAIERYREGINKMHKVRRGESLSVLRKDFHKELYRLYLRTGNPEGAINVSKELIKFDKDDISASLDLAKALISNSESLTQGGPILESLYQRFPNDFSVVGTYLDYLDMTGQGGKAFKLYKKWASIEKNYFLSDNSSMHVFWDTADLGFSATRRSRVILKKSDIHALGTISYSLKEGSARHFRLDFPSPAPDTKIKLSNIVFHFKTRTANTPNQAQEEASLHWTPAKNNSHDLLVDGNSVVINGLDPFLIQPIPERVRNKGKIEVKVEFALSFETSTKSDAIQSQFKDILRKGLSPPGYNRFEVFWNTADQGFSANRRSGIKPTITDINELWTLNYTLKEESARQFRIDFPSAFAMKISHVKFHFKSQKRKNPNTIPEEAVSTWKAGKHNSHDLLIIGEDAVINGLDPYLFQTIPERIRNKGNIEVKVEFALRVETSSLLDLAQLKLKNTLSSAENRIALAKTLEALKE